MPRYDEVIVVLLFVSFLIWDHFSGVYKRNKRAPGEWLVDAISLPALAIIKPIVMAAGFGLGALILPGASDGLGQLPFWLACLVVFIPDDFGHYWIHRLAHNRPSFWPFHRTHHTSTGYQTSVAFRENCLWWVVQPGFWWQGLMIYLGLLEEVLLVTTIIGVHNIFLHNSSTKDRVLYTNRFTRGPMKMFEYLVNTPGLHRAHHGLGKNSVPFGNYGQTLFIWDVIFGTAVFNKGLIPEYYAVSNPEIMKQPWYYHLWWPLVKKRSETDPSLEVSVEN